MLDLGTGGSEFTHSAKPPPGGCWSMVSIPNASVVPATCRLVPRSSAVTCARRAPISAFAIVPIAAGFLKTGTYSEHKQVRKVFAMRFRGHWADSRNFSEIDFGLWLDVTAAEGWCAIALAIRRHLRRAIRGDDIGRNSGNRHRTAHKAAQTYPPNTWGLTGYVQLIDLLASNSLRG